MQHLLPHLFHQKQQEQHDRPRLRLRFDAFIYLIPNNSGYRSLAESKSIIPCAISRQECASERASAPQASSNKDKHDEDGSRALIHSIIASQQRPLSRSGRKQTDYPLYDFTPGVSECAPSKKQQGQARLGRQSRFDSLIH
jgi:hypothetical protein